MMDFFFFFEHFLLSPYPNWDIYAWLRTNRSKVLVAKDRWCKHMHLYYQKRGVCLFLRSSILFPYERPNNENTENHYHLSFSYQEYLLMKKI